MRTDLAANWEERRALLSKQIESAPDDARVWRWRAEARVLCFLSRRYGEDRRAIMQAPVEPEKSASERALLRMALLSPNGQSKKMRPSPRDRTTMLERIGQAGEEARDISDEEDRKIKQHDRTIYLELRARQGAEERREREREREWKRRRREREEEWKRNLSEREKLGRKS